MKYLFLGIAVLLLSCSSNKDKPAGGVIKYSERESVQVWDPMLISHNPTNRVLSHIHEGLVRLNPRNLIVEPALCSSFEFDEEKLSYIFTLRDDIYFHDADCFENKEDRKITSQDVKYSFERLCKSQFVLVAYLEAFKNVVIGAEAFHEGESNEITGIKTPDNNTVVIELKYPQSSFLEKISTSRYSIVSKKAIEKYNTKSKIGAGPFKFALSTDTSTILVRNEDYYLIDHSKKSLPYLDSIYISYEGSTEKIVDQLKTNQTDLILNLRANVLTKLMRREQNPIDENYQIRNAPHLSTYILELNNTKEPFNHKPFRIALNSAINKERLCEVVFGKTTDRVGEFGVTHPAIYPNFQYFNRANSYDIEKAKAILKKLEDSLGTKFSEKPIELEISVDDPMAIEAGNEIAYQLKQNLGLNIQLNFVPALYKIEKSKFARGDMYISIISAKYPSPESFLIHFYGGNIPKNLNLPSYPNTTRFNNEHFNFSFNKARRSLQKEDAYRYYSIAEKTLLEEAPVSVLWYGETNQIVHQNLENLELNSLLELDFRYVRWQKDSIIN
jgi:peptide/nickel transport system substrate-binding protein